jgi:hypothetical protein
LKPSKGYVTSALLQSLAHKSAILLSFPVTQNLRNSVLFPSPSDGEIDALLAILLLKQPIVESFRVFSNPAKILQWILLLIIELREFSPCTCLHTNSMTSWQSYTKLLRDSSSFELTVEFFLCALLALAQCPLGRAL